MPTGADIARKHGTFIRLVATGTGLSFRTVVAWTTIEDGPIDNPLNIGPGNHYGSGPKAAAATIALLRRDIQNRYGYRDILASAGQSDAKQLAAIAASKWEASHYDGGMRLFNTYNAIYPSSKIRFSPKDITVKNPVTQIDDALGLAGSGLGSLIGNIVSVQFWIRAALVIIGGVFLIGALIIFSRELAQGGLVK